MSRARVRITRDETRARLFRAAAVVVAAQGAGGATIEQIAVEAGFTRGAVYSNFADKDELLVAMLEDHLARSQTSNRDLQAAHPEPADLVSALRRDEDRDDPLHERPLLQIELMLHVARNPELRPTLGRRLKDQRELFGEIATGALAAAGVEVDADAHQLGTILVALEDGLRLHRLIDPEATPDDAFFDALEVLQRVIADRPR